MQERTRRISDNLRSNVKQERGRAYLSASSCLMISSVAQISKFKRHRAKEAASGLYALWSNRDLVKSHTRRTVKNRTLDHISVLHRPAGNFKWIF